MACAPFQGDLSGASNNCKDHYEGINMRRQGSAGMTALNNLSNYVLNDLSLLIYVECLIERLIDSAMEVCATK